MAEFQLCTLADAPPEGTGKIIHVIHPVTDWEFDLALFQVNGKFYSILNECNRCTGKLGNGALSGMYVICPSDDTPWNIKNGLCRYDRSQSMPTYRVKIENDALITNL